MLARFRIAAAASGLFILFAAETGPVPARAWNAITSAGLLKHIRVLSSDEFEGRAPSTTGEQKTIEYLISQCRALKLKPGNPDGSYLQKVALWGITAGDGQISIQSSGSAFPLTAQDYRASTSQPQSSVAIPES